MVTALKQSTATAITYTNCCGAFLIMKEFEVWTEGFAVTGQSSGAVFHGKVMAKSFDEACIKLLGSSLDKDESKPDGYRRNSKGNMCVWACGCYDNEDEARAYFG